MKIKSVVKGAVIFTGGITVGVGVCSRLILNYLATHENVTKTIANDTIEQFMKPKKVAKCKYYSKMAYYDQLVKEIEFGTLKDVETVIREMNDLIRKYGCATVSDFVYLSGVDYEYDDCYADDYGWINYFGYENIFQEGHQFKLNLPKVKAL